jgi:hypothetical protein
MRFFKCDRSSQTLSKLDTLPDSASFTTTSTRSTQQGTLALPTQLEKFVEAAHTGTIRHIPGEEASEDEVRYFLYQVLTLAKYKIGLCYPQWVLETCMYWKGNGSKLRSLTNDGFQLLCPLSSGHAIIDWGTNNSKFKLEPLPPPAARSAIAELVRNVVNGIKMKARGNRKPGWQVSDAPRKTATTLPEGMIKMQASTYRQDQRSLTPWPTPPLGFLIQSPSLTFTNQSSPLVQEISPAHAEQAPTYIQFGMPTASSGPQIPDSKSGRNAIPGNNSSDLGLPALSYRQTDSFSSQLSESTAKTSPPDSENETNFWAADIDRPRSIAPSVLSGLNIGCATSGLYQNLMQHTSKASPSRYKAYSSSQTAHLNGPSFHPARHFSHLRCGSYVNSPGNYAQSNAFLASSGSGTCKQSLRRDSRMYPEMVYPSLVRNPSFYPEIGAEGSRPIPIYSYTTEASRACPSAESIIEGHMVPHIKAAIPLVRARTAAPRPVKNFKVDSYALDSAEYVSLKSIPSPVHMRVAETRQHCLSRWKSDGALGHHTQTFVHNTRADEKPADPSMWFPHLQMGLPRLMLYGTIKGKRNP